MKPAEDIARECQVNRKTVQKVYKELREHLLDFNQSQKIKGHGEAGGFGAGHIILGKGEYPLFYLVGKDQHVSIYQPEEFEKHLSFPSTRKLSVLMVYQRNKVSGGFDPGNIYRRVLSDDAGDSSCKDCLQFMLEKMKAYRGIPADRLQLYLEEMVFRFNCRNRVDAMRHLISEGQKISGNHTMD